MACLEVDGLGGILNSTGLGVEELKTHNALYGLRMLPGGIFRRTDDVDFSSKRYAK